MQDPVVGRSEHVEAGQPVPPPAPTAGGVPPAGYEAPYGERVVATRSSVVPVAYRARSLVWLILAIVELILALRFIFYAAGANNTGFAHYIYRLGSALDAPFRGIFNTTVTPGGHPLQWADILAIVIYAVAAWIVTRLMVIGSTPPTRTGPAV